MVRSIMLGATSVEVSRRDATIEIPSTINLLRIRGNLNGGMATALLRNRLSGELLYSLSPHGPDGQSALPLTARHQSLVHAAREYDLVELDVDCDLRPQVLSAIPARQRLICWEGPGGDITYLRSVFKRMSAVPARFYSMIIKGASFGDGVKPLLLLKELGRRDVIAICEGKYGFWSRVLSPYFGAPVVFGTLDHNQTDDSCGPSVRQLIVDYGFPMLHPLRELYGIVGNRVVQSLSPRMHNAGYRALNHPALFLPFHVDSFDDCWRELIEPSVLETLGLPLKGLTIVSPHKEAAYAAASSRSPMASKVGASNIFLRRNGSWEAHTTDTESITGITENGNSPRAPFKAAVIGCGGAGRAIAAALQQAGAHVTLVNRGQERGDLAVRLLGLPFIALSRFQPKGFSLLVNATPVGRDDNSTPFDIDALSPDTLVIDLVYRAQPTSLAASVTARGGTIIDGYDVLLNQVRKQFHMMTGCQLPLKIGRRTATSQEFENGISLTRQLREEELPASLTEGRGLGVESAPPS